MMTVEPVSAYIATGIYKQCWADVSEDGADFDTWKANENHLHLGAFVDGLLVGVNSFEFMTGAMANSHAAYLPIAYGKISKGCGALALEYIWDNTGVEVVIAMTPEHNRVTLLYLKHLGFERSGIVPRGYRHAGKVEDLIISNVTRGV